MMNFRYCLTAALLTVGVLSAGIATAASAQEDTVMLGGRRVVVWHPRTTARGPQPVIIFSHGLGGCPTQSRFMTEGLAERGYWVFAPFHHDAGCGKKGPVARSPIPFDEPARWSARTFSSRIDDIQAIIAALSVAPWSGRVDLDRLAIAGHSLGGYTAIGFAGGWPSPSSKPPVVRAVLAMAPYADPFLVHGTLSSFDIPVMYQGGTLDAGISHSLRKRGGVYDRTGGPKYLVEFSGARHSSWGNKANRAHEAMLAYAGAFLDMYVRGIDAGTQLTRRLPGVAELRSSVGGQEAIAANHAGKSGVLR
jgi:predicted dienelactone hydrolase